MTAVAIRRGVTSFWIGIGAERAHGVDLLGHLHGAEFAGDAGGVAAGHQQRGQHRPEFAHQGDGDDVARCVPPVRIAPGARDICSAMTAPLKKPVRITIGRLPTPMMSICRKMSSV